MYCELPSQIVGEKNQMIHPGVERVELRRIWYISSPFLGTTLFLQTICFLMVKYISILRDYLLNVNLIVSLGEALVSTGHLEGQTVTFLREALNRVYDSMEDTTIELGTPTTATEVQKIISRTKATDSTTIELDRSTTATEVIHVYGSSRRPSGTAEAHDCS
jgi:hypothetical protein